ncbi:phenylacetate--CoA ligase family protein [Polluticaenibacter yanchengensis]|uniref:AMP-binding protein n=1 Tax=Polluticaenibacter yanchengensis TaxID=3014562 RepID=A0ABT4UK58_9BACT|nr:AMP-binding protein [Chitinophagaceae bacterium LY-5]
MIPLIETATRQEIKIFQEAALRDLLVYLHEHSPFYKDLFANHHIDISKVNTLEDLEQLPVTTKKDLQLRNNDFFCVPKSEIVDFSTTSGTLGKPVTFGLTDKDLERLAYNEAISLSCAGIRKGHVVQLMTTIDRCFVAGLAYFLGLRKIGAGVIRIGAGTPQLQWDSILANKPRYLIAVPSFLLKLIDYAQEHGIDYNNAGIEGIVCIGEALKNQDLTNSILADKILSKWQVKLYSTYASTEMGTAFTECSAQCGGHHHPELIIIEVLNNNNEPVKKGEVGELTITTLGVEAMPLLRFKTGDMVQVIEEPCNCGRTTVRVGPVVGRKDHMIKYKGTTVYPPAIFDLLNHFDAIQLYQVILTTSSAGTDDVLIKMTASDTSQAFLDEIRAYLKSKIRVTPAVEFVPFEVLSRTVFDIKSRKPIYLVDKRSL